ncbi:MAG: ArsR/SmtB family transcription factor [Acidimicrobiales bacterium]
MNPRPKGLAHLDAIELVYSALAHQTRRQILTVLRARGGSATSGELAQRFDCTWPTTTRHLNVLADGELVTVTHHGRQRTYQLNANTLDAIAGAWIDRFRTDSR